MMLLAAVSGSFSTPPAVQTRQAGCAARAWRGLSMQATETAPKSFVQTEMRSEIPPCPVKPGQGGGWGRGG